MDTFYAPPERASREELQQKLRIISDNPFLDSLLKSLSGLIAVLDEHRQILTVNDNMLKMLGYSDADRLLGLRPGEALQCIHAQEEPAGCGTTRFCSSCGAAIAMVVSLARDKPEERLCAATLRKDGKEIEICFQVRSHPVTFAGQRFLLLFLQDITNQQTWAALERVFFHDINNIVTGLQGTADLLSCSMADPNLSSLLHQLVLRLKKEMDIQRVLSHTKAQSYQVALQEIPVIEVLREMRNFFAGHPAAIGKLFIFPLAVPQVKIVTDCSLLQRVLTNMVTNAFEATEPGGEVKIWLDEDDRSITFCVWNRQVLADEVRLRIFQRHFTTKKGPGRGVGTFSMKFFGEQFLKGTMAIQ
ncbi:MAG: PAS domain-containing sensor histidine kinase [Deltaproteobacteria bacterium]|nr:PAS domain-containing sensor histidine kinase [Deltaproteobacteria bacterium]